MGAVGVCVCVCVCESVKENIHTVCITTRTEQKLNISFSTGMLKYKLAVNTFTLTFTLHYI